MLSMGHKIVRLARYEGLKVEVRTILFNLSHVSFHAHPRPRGIVLRLGYVLGSFLWKFNQETNSDFPIFDGPNYMRLFFSGIVSRWPRGVCRLIIIWSNFACYCKGFIQLLCLSSIISVVLRWYLWTLVDSLGVWRWRYPPWSVRIHSL